jgi:DNA/RNA endonuclease YhcR with UshA esterase domain
VTGTLAWFSGELEVVGSSGSPMIVESLGTGTTPAPRTISGAEFLSRAYEGQLVRLGSVVADSIGSVSGSGGYTVWVITTDDERVQVRVNSTAIGIPVGTWTVGGTYDVVGALARFGGHTTQLKPRSAADVTAGDPDVISIAAAEQLANGDTVIIEGVVTAPVGPFGTLNAYLQDGTGGIQIFGVDTAAVDLEIGDLIRVRGVMGTFNNERQVARFSSTAPLQITVLGDAAVPASRPVSGADILARTYEGELVSLAGVTVDSVGTASSSGAYNVIVIAADGSELTLRNDRAAVGVPLDFWVVGAVYDVTGIATNFLTGGVNIPQLKFRGTFDVVRR